MNIEIPKNLSEENNIEFKRLYKKYYGVNLTAEQANEEAHRLLTFYAAIVENYAKKYE